jgi:hypothetical protein
MVALTVVVPAATPVASPDESMMAMAVEEDDQCTWVVTFSVEWSANVAMAVNGSVAPAGMLGSAGFTAIETRGAGLTVNTAVPSTPCNVAVIVDIPGATPIASPRAVMVATDVALDAQVT